MAHRPASVVAAVLIAAAGAISLRAGPVAAVALRVEATGSVSRAEPPDPARVRAALDTAYRGIRARPTLPEMVGRAVGSFLRWVAQRLADATSAAGIATWAVLIGALVGMVLLLRRLGIVPDVVPERRRERAGAGPPDWERLAEEARARGDLNEAVRLSFRALIATLDARGVIVDRPSVTAGDCRTAVGSRLPAAVATVERAADAFERAAYAHAAASNEELDSVREAEREVARR